MLASTTGTNADWVVKLIDIYPDSLLHDPRMAVYQGRTGGLDRGPRRHT